MCVLAWDQSCKHLDQSSCIPLSHQRESGCWVRYRPPVPRLVFASTRCLTSSRSCSALMAEPRTRPRIPNSPPCIFNCLDHASPEEHQGFNILSTAQHRNRTERFAFTTDTASAIVSQLPFPPEPSLLHSKNAQMPASVSLSNILMSRYILHS